MYPRIGILQKVFNPSIINGIKPYGQDSEKQNLEAFNLLSEESEAIRLNGWDMLNHYQASVMMGIYRPTVTKTDGSSLQKVAKAFVEELQITIRSGKVNFNSDWHHYNTCKCYFNPPEKGKKIQKI